MIVPDINLLVYAYNADAPLHAKSRKWWEALLNGNDPVSLPWAVTCGFIRLMSHPSVLRSPLSSDRAIHHVRTWLSAAHVRTIDPGNRHLEILGGLLAAAGVAGNLTTDAHIAAIAIEYQCEVHSNDTDFGRFPGLRWRNPL